MAKQVPAQPVTKKESDTADSKDSLQGSDKMGSLPESSFVGPHVDVDDLDADHAVMIQNRGLDYSSDDSPIPTSQMMNKVIGEQKGSGKEKLSAGTCIKNI